METQKLNLQGKLNLLFSVVIIILFFCLWKSCGGNSIIQKGTVTVAVAERSGKFEPVKPIQATIQSKTSEKDIQTILNTQNDKEVKFWKSESERLLAENQLLDDAFSRANDSLQQIIYRQAVAIQAYSKTFENDTLKIDVKGLVRGEIQSMQVDWKIKSFKAEVPAPQLIRFRIRTGLEFGNSKAFDEFLVKGNLGFENAKGNVFTISADTKQRFWAGLTVPILTIKK